MTRKLYYEDSYLETFKAKVVACTPCEEGYEVVLDQTAFYPGGGGQAMDRGFLNDQEVIGMAERGDVISHVVVKPFEIGEEIVGEVFIEKRIDYMVQHTGEHIISGIINKLFGYSNTGFYLSESYMTADFDGELTKEQLEMIELKANEAVMRNVAVYAKVYALADEVPTYRSKLQFETDVRLVTVEDYDCCACCGTHISRTGEVGIIKITGYEKHRGGCRLTILCGRRGVYDYQNRFNELGELSAQLSAKVGSITKATTRLQEEVEKLKQRLYSRNEQYFELLMKNYPKDRPLCVKLTDIAMDETKGLTEKLLEEERQEILLLFPEAQGFKYIALSKQTDMRDFCKRLNEKVEGKGGGKAMLCQGSAKGDVEVAETFFYEYFKSWVKEIESYKPYNEQETKDKEVFLNYIYDYDNTLDRSNDVAHVTSSAWIVNKDRSKVLMAHHNIYNAWAWTGGHNDGESDMLGVAIREAKEETGISEVHAVSEAIFSIDVLEVAGHIKKGKYVASHLHLSVAYLLEADDTLPLEIKADENSGVMWIPVEELDDYTANEPNMQILYNKFMDKIREEH